ncbi:hypothetical protein C9975_04800 [Thalassospira xiamenensis]|nr:hypothetical protein C9975_04800 [Thalassospira xiamenensis]
MTANKSDTKAIEKNSVPMPMLIGIGIIVFLALVAFTMNQLIEVKGREIALEVIAEYEQTVPRAKVVTIDRDQMIARLSEETSDKTRILKAISMLTELMQQDGYFVVNSDAVMMTSPQFIVKSFSLMEIERMAEARNIDVDEQTERMIRETEKAAKKKLEELNRLVEQFKSN